MFVSAVLVVLPPLIGLVPTMIGMMRAFRSLSETGVSSPDALSGSISTALWATGVGVLVSVFAGLALVVSVIGLIVERRRARVAVSQTA